MLKVLMIAAVVTVGGTRKDALYNDDFVVTNVTVDLGHLATTNQLKEAADEAKAGLRAELAAATNGIADAVDGRIAAASNNLAAAMRQDVAEATNSAERATDAKLAGYATRSWVTAQGYASGQDMNSYAQRNWVQEQGYAPKSWVEGKGYLTQHQSLEGYAPKSWVEGKGYARRAEIAQAVADAMTGSAAGTAHRLMTPGDDEWIDGTGTVWRTAATAEWNGETVQGLMETNRWEAETWSLEYQGYTSATGTWTLVRRLSESGPLEVVFEGSGLPGTEGRYRLDAARALLAGAEVTPGQVTESGWYQIPDGEGMLFFVTPLVTTVTVARATNAVDRLAKAGETYTKEQTDARIAAIPGMTTNDVCAIVTNEVEEWQFAGLKEKSWALGEERQISEDAIISVEYVQNGETIWENSEPHDTYWKVVWNSEMFGGVRTGYDPDKGPETAKIDAYMESARDEYLTISRRKVASNALGLARRSDVPTDNAQLANGAGYVVFNDVCNIVTNEVTSWEIAAPSDVEIRGVPEYFGVREGLEGTWWRIPVTYMGLSDYDWERGEESDKTIQFGATNVRATRITRNALGFARLSDLPDTSDFATKSDVEDLEDAQEGFLRDLAAGSNRVDNLAGSVNVLWSHVYGNSVWIAVTNYLRTIEGVVPSFQLWEVRDGVTNCVYSSAEEITNLTAKLIKDRVADATTGMPTKAWSKYQSGTGAENPQPGAVTIVSTPNVMLTGGGEWYKCIETGDAAVWVLKSNGLCTFGGDTNGYFRIVDDEGTPHFEIVKTASFEVDAIASDTAFDASDNFTVTYNANMANPPTLYAAANLDDQFVGEDGSHNINSLGISVAWAKNASGYWVATVHQDSRLPRLFVHAKVLQEGQNAIRYTAPTILDGGLIIGGVKYTIVPYTTGGKTYLTLEAQ